jgi:hypothetical protein
MCGCVASQELVEGSVPLKVPEDNQAVTNAVSQDGQMYGLASELGAEDVGLADVGDVGADVRRSHLKINPYKGSKFASKIDVDSEDELYFQGTFVQELKMALLMRLNRPRISRQDWQLMASRREQQVMHLVLRRCRRGSARTCRSCWTGSHPGISMFTMRRQACCTP